MTDVLKTDTLGHHKTLIMMVGLPYSGKSTDAQALGFPMVNPDSIRVAIHGHKFIPETEPLVWAAAKIMVRSLFLSGHDTVILDATNTAVKRRQEWISDDWLVNAHIIDIPVQECIDRAIAAGDDIMVPIIERMAEQMDFDGINQDEED